MDKSRKTNRILLGTLIALACYYSYLAYHDTFYRIGLILTPVFLIVAGIVPSIVFLMRKSTKRNWFLLYSATACILFITFIIAIHIDIYKTQVKIFIPSEYQGMIHLFEGKISRTEFHINEHGIAYPFFKGKMEYKIYHGKKDITNALNEYGHSNLIFPFEDSSKYRGISTTCFEVSEGRKYPESPWNQYHATCLDESLFIEYLEQNIIDSSMISNKVWEYNSP